MAHSLGAHCCGLIFGRVKKAGQWGRDMATRSAHIDWCEYTLPNPEHSQVPSIKTCLAVLTLFAAFPELDRVPAQNRTGKQWALTNTPSPIGVGEDSQGIDVYCMTIEEQIALRHLMTQNNAHVFTSNVHTLLTSAMHRQDIASDVGAAVAAASRALTGMSRQ